MAGLTSPNQYFGSVDLVSQQFIPIIAGTPAAGILGEFRL